MKKICIFGGSSLYRLPVYNQMSKEIDCDFYIVEDDPSMGIKTYDHKELSNYKGSFYPMRLVGNFFWLNGALSLLKEDYDIYVLGSPFCISYWFIAICCSFSKKKATSWSHGMYGKESGLRKLIKKLYFNICSMNFVYNERAIDVMEQSGISRAKVRFVGNSLDTDHDLNIRAKLHKTDVLRRYFKNDYPILIFVGRVTSIKRLDMVLDAMEILQKGNTPVNFFVVGKDVDGVNLAAYAKSKGLSDQLYLYGPCYDDTVLGNLYYNADLCVSPGNVGLTAISAMTFGCPVISHNNLNLQMPEYETIKPGKTGEFFKEGDVVDLASKISTWLNNVDDNKRDYIRKCAFEEVDTKWNIYSETQCFKDAFNKL